MPDCCTSRTSPEHMNGAFHVLWRASAGLVGSISYKHDETQSLGACKLPAPVTCKRVASCWRLDQQPRLFVGCAPVHDAWQGTFAAGGSRAFLSRRPTLADILCMCAVLTTCKASYRHVRIAFVSGRRSPQPDVKADALLCMHAELRCNLYRHTTDAVRRRVRAEQVTKPVRTSLHYVPIYLQCHKRASLVEAKNAAQNCRNPANSNSAPQPS